jgi:hypothetical protein
MSQVQLKVRPRRVRCTTSCEPPPFSFDTGVASRQRPTGAALVAQLPFKGIWLMLAACGKLIDAAFFLTALTIWCAIHITLWSYAFEMGPAADCFGLPCPTDWLGSKVLLTCAGLAVFTFVSARIMRRLGHRATSFMLLVLVTFDVAALLVLGIHSLI